MTVDQIKTCMRQWGIKQGWLAQKLNVSHSLVSYWFSNDRKMPEEYREKASRLLMPLMKEAV